MKSLIVIIALVMPMNNSQALKYGCSTKLMIKLKDYAKNHIEWLQGTYIQQSFQINGRNCWFQVDDRGAIWFEKGGQWIAGLRSGRTLGTKSGYLVDHESNKVVCPNNAKHWQIYSNSGHWVPVSSEEVKVQELTDCPKHLVIKLDPKKYSSDKLKKLAKTYSIEKDYLNGKNYWTSTDNQFVIWEDFGEWRIGGIEIIGPGEINYIMKATSGDAHCPNLVTNTWMYNPNNGTWLSMDGVKILESSIESNEEEDSQNGLLYMTAAISISINILFILFGILFIICLLKNFTISRTHIIAADQKYHTKDIDFSKTNQVLQDATKKENSDIRIRRNSNVDSFQSGMEDIEFPDYYTEPTHEDNLEENNYESLY